MNLISRLFLFACFVLSSGSEEYNPNFSKSNFNPSNYIKTLNWNKFLEQNFVFESSIVLILLIYSLNWLRGSKTNRKLAIEYTKLIDPLFDTYFSFKGFNPALLSRDGPDSYFYYASGRKYINSLTVHIQLSPRHDLTSYILDFFGYRLMPIDSVSFECELTKTDPFVFALLSKPLSTKIMLNRYDIKAFTKSRCDKLDKSLQELYSIYSDNPEFTLKITQDPVITKLLLNLNHFESLIYSDLPEESPEKLIDVENCKKRLKVCFKLGNLVDSDFEFKHVSIFKLTMYIIDYLGQHGSCLIEIKEKIQIMRKSIKDELIKKNEQIDSSKLKNQEIQTRKKNEQKQREEMLSNLSPDARRKAEEKEKRQDAKKEQRKMMKKGKMVLS